MRKSLTVKELKEKLKNVNDDAIVILSSDSGVDQGFGTIIVEDAWLTHYNMFAIYCNDYEDIEEEEEDE